jgi:LmbE family N-acetylglucosaminyl deacetylase
MSPPRPALFHPAEQGTRESEWTHALAECPEWHPTSRVLVVSPHPDDEVLAAGGLLRSLTHAGMRAAVLCVTDGEAAYPDWEGLATLRRSELHRALAVLHEHAIDVTHLGLPDGRVGEYPEALFDAVDRLVTPTTTLVAPYLSDGHPDHEATGLICRQVARQRGVALAQYPIWAWHHQTPAHFASAAWRRFMLDPAARLAKSTALRCFASQLNPHGRQPIVPPHVLRYFDRPYEAFIV